MPRLVSIAFASTATKLWSSRGHQRPCRILVVLSNPLSEVARRASHKNNISLSILEAISSQVSILSRHISKTLPRMARPPLRGIIFDMDGTLTKPQNYMFKQMRAALGIDKSQDILLSIEELPENEQEAAHDKIRKIERAAMSEMQAQDGLSTLMKYLDTTSLQRGICTRNFHEPTQHLLRTHLQAHTITPVLTREFTPPKPSPRPLQHICEAWNIRPSECIMVGDGTDDIVSAREAGMDSILLRNKDNHNLVEEQNPTLVVDDLSEIIDIVRRRI